MSACERVEAAAAQLTIDSGIAYFEFKGNVGIDAVYEALKKYSSMGADILPKVVGALSMYDNGFTAMGTKELIDIYHYLESRGFDSEIPVAIVVNEAMLEATRQYALYQCSKGVPRYATTDRNDALVWLRKQIALSVTGELSGEYRSNKKSGR